MTLDGREVRHPAPSTARLGPSQRAVLRALGFGSLTSTQAGKICHETRGWCGWRTPYGAWNEQKMYKASSGSVLRMGNSYDVNKHKYAGQGCCPYACSEGTEVMKRLKRRGFADKIGGLWYAAEAWHQSSWKELA